MVLKNLQQMQLKRLQKEWFKKEQKQLLIYFSNEIADKIKRVL